MGGEILKNLQSEAPTYYSMPKSMLPPFLLFEVNFCETAWRF